MNDIAISVRRAKPEDAPEIANVHLNSWREAYRNILPQSYLDQLPLSFKGRMNRWAEGLKEEDDITYVADTEKGIVGFAAFNGARDEELGNYGELGAIYLFERFKGKAVGYELLKRGFADLYHKQFRKGYCWVIANNPTVRFYERCGGIANGMSKEIEIGGQKIKEIVLVWNDLKVFV
ncbi:MAG: N-acetyltransferase family protein [Oligoflexales bacterium]